MLPHVATTLRLALRTPSVWVLALLGALSVLVGLSLSVLALGDLGATGVPLLRESARTTAALLALWTLCLGHELDRTSGFTPALDATAPGPSGRWWGRVLGALFASLPGALPATLLGAALLGLGGGEIGWLLFTTSPSVLLVLAWGRLLLSLTGAGPTALLGGLFLWGAGHLPWGQPGWGGAPWGRFLGALLPGGNPLAEGAAALGLLVLAGLAHRRASVPV